MKRKTEPQRESDDIEELRRQLHELVDEAFNGDSTALEILTQIVREALVEQRQRKRKRSK